MKKNNTVAVFIFGIILFVVTLGFYWQTRTFEFINYDDFEYIHKNGAVTNGLTCASIKWAFGPEQCRQMSNWHPVTTLSWMLDVSLFGVSSGAMHIHNSVIHSINGVLLFLFLMLLLGCLEGAGRQEGNEKCNEVNGKSISGLHISLLTYFAAFIGAAFWAWHPLRAESVAWVSSRKDVLSIFFLLPGLMAYLKVLKGGNKAWLFVSGLCYLLAYFSKPTAVVYPLLAVFLEYSVTRKVSWRQNELLIYLMVILMAVTFIVQDTGGATVMSLTLMLRLENAVAGVGHYIMATLWPTNLSIFYKYEIPVPWQLFLPGCGFVLTVFWFLLNQVWPRMEQYWKDRQTIIGQHFPPVEPLMMLALGILWFGISLAPVVGLIQVGFASFADRYTYLSGIGLSIGVSLAVWVIQVRVLQLKSRIHYFLVQAFFCLCIAVFFCFLALQTCNYVSQFRNSKTVFDNATRVTKGNYPAYNNAGTGMLAEGRHQEAMEYFLESVKYMFAEIERKRIHTAYKDNFVANMTIAFSAIEGGGVENTPQGVRLKENVVLSTKVKADDPVAAKKFFIQGLYSYYKGLDSLAIHYFNEALKLAPSDDYLWRFKGYTFDRLGEKEEAMASFKRSYELKPEKDIQKRIAELEQSLEPGGDR